MGLLSQALSVYQFSVFSYSTKAERNEKLRLLPDRGLPKLSAAAPPLLVWRKPEPRKGRRSPLFRA